MPSLSSLFSLGFELYSRWVLLMICSGIWYLVFGINTTSDISKLLYIISLACEQALCFGEKKARKGKGRGGGRVASPETSFGVLFGHAFLEMKAWQRTPKDVCREAKESLCYCHFVIKSPAVCRPKRRCQSALSTVSVLANRTLHQDPMHGGRKCLSTGLFAFSSPLFPLYQRPVHRL